MRSPRALLSVKLCTLAYCAAVCTINAQAQTTWVGGGNGNWNVGSNWSTGNVPGSATNALIDSGTANLPLGVTGVSGTLVIGGSSAGALNISSGSLSNSSVLVGNLAGSNGTVTVSSGTWYTSVTTGSFVVGNSGTGTLNIGTTGLVNLNFGSGTAVLGNGAGSLGNMVLNGGTMFAGAYIIGNSGTGVLTLSAGTLGVATSGIMTLGNAAGSNGMVVMTTGSWGGPSTTTIVGNSGTGSFTVNGGSVKGGITIGNHVGSTGTMVFNSGTWSDASFAVGSSGTGSLTINGGVIDASLFAGIGSGTGSPTGVVTMTGGTFTLTQNGSIMTIGNSGTATGTALFLQQGGYVGTVGVAFKSNAAGNGTATITGGTWVDSGTGGFTGTATLNVGGGSLSTRVTNLTGTANVSGGTWANSGNFAFSTGVGNGVLNLTGSGALILGSGTGTLALGQGGVINIGTGGAAGALSAGAISGSGATTINFNQSGKVFFTPAIIQTSGSTQVNNVAGIAILGGTSLAGVGGINISSGTLQIGNGSALSNLASFTITDNGTLAFGTGGTFTVQNSITGTGGITQAGPGVVALTGTGNSYSGATSVNGGTLSLDFSQLAGRSSNLINNVANNSALALGGGTLGVTGSNGATNSQRFNGTTLNDGASGIVMNQNGAANLSLSLGGITRNAGSTLNITLPATGAVSTTTGTDSTGLLGAGITVNGSDWATVSGGNVVAFSGYTINSNAATWAAGQHISNTSGGANPYAGVVGSNLTIGSLKFDNASSGTVSIGAGNILTISDGILVTSAVGVNSSGITDGTLRGAAGMDLVVINNNLAGALTIGSTITDNTTPTALTKSGTGVLALTGSSNYTGPTYLNAGTLAINGAFSIGSGQLIVNGGNLDNTSGSSVTFANNQLWKSDFAFAGSNNLAGSGTVTLGGAGVARNVAVNSGTFSTGPITGSGYGLVKSGSGVLNLTGSTDYAGDLTVSAGLVTINAGAVVNHNGRTETIGSASGDDGSLFLNGGSITDSNVVIGSGVGSKGAVTVGSGTWSTGSLTVGLWGAGALSLNGGIMTDSAVVIGANQGSSGTVTINSGTWSNSSPLVVGNSGTGTLNLNGGVVSVGGGNGEVQLVTGTGL